MILAKLILNELKPRLKMSFFYCVQIPCTDDPDFAILKFTAGPPYEVNWNCDGIVMVIDISPLISGHWFQDCESGMGVFMAAWIQEPIQQQHSAALVPF